ncbi:MAG: ABC transporter substrate-binding protein [Betaproteobacteria bacterium]
MAVALVAALVAPSIAAAQPTRTLRVAFSVAETGFDPQVIPDTYSSMIASAIFEPLYTYDYFALPAKLAPAAAEALPEVSADLTTYTIRLKRGLRFADDPVFGGKPREVTAQDYVYSWKRLLDPKVRSYFVHVFENRLVGGDEAIARARKSGSFDYDAPIAGLVAVDRTTIRVRFTEPYFGFRHWLTTVTFAAVAREVVDKHKDASNRVAEHPVGSGPYRLAEWRRSQKIVLEANPLWRDLRYPAAVDAADRPIAAGLTGRKLPLVPRVEITIVEEAQPRLLSFERGEIDMVDLPNDLAPNVLDGDVLKPAYAKRGIGHTRMLEPALNFTYFNLDDPTVGGYTPEKIALRRAMIMGYDRDTEIRVLRNGQATPATQVSPPWTEGYDTKRAPLQAFDPAGARALLDRFGYKDRNGDGYRERPDGKPLVVEKASTPNATDRASDELWRKSMDAIGLRMTFVKQKWPDLVKMAEAGKLQMWGLGWILTIPDPDSTYALLYSKQVGMMNDARLRLPEYDKLYEASRRLPDGAERDALYAKMTDLMSAYGVWEVGPSRYSNWLTQPRLKGFKRHPFLQHRWEYYDVE